MFPTGTPAQLLSISLFCVELEFTGEIWHWRGPAAHHFVTVPPEQAEEIAAIAPGVSYGWGVVPVLVRIGSTDFTTSLFPRDGGYLLQIKAEVRRAEGLELGDVVSARLTL
jgi:hypothetical protein